MEIEIRPLRSDEEMQALARIVSYSFADSMESAKREVSFLDKSDTLGAFVGGTLATTMAAYPFTVRLNGAPVRMAGVTQVGTLPAYRRRGLLRSVMREGLSRYKDRGESFAILVASMGAIYQRFGYGLVTNLTTYTFDPRWVPLREPVEPRGHIELVPQSHARPILREIYDRWAEPRTLCLERNDSVWSAKTWFGLTSTVYHAVYRNEAGEPEGYLTYTTKQMESDDPIIGPDQEMDVRDFIAVTIEAWRHLWDYIGKHDLVGRVTMRRCLAEDDPAWHLVLEPRQLQRRLGDGIWMRVIDAGRGLAQRPYSEPGKLAIRVTGDNLCPWNEGAFLLDTDGPNATVLPALGGADLTLGPLALAQLISGHSTATHLARCGLVEARDPAVLTLADRMFATAYRPHCADGF